MNKKTIWITGGSTGIGKALAIKFANEGWKVAISARRENLLKEVSDQHENISHFPLDVTDKIKCKEVFNDILKKFEQIDICFFSTGTWNPKKEKEIDVSQIEDVFKVNFFGTLNSIKAVEEYFKRSNVRVCLVSPGFIKTPMTDKNDFKMPFLKSSEYAAEKIYDGLINKKVFEIHFPKSLTMILKILNFFPDKIYFSLIGRLTKYQKKS